MGGYPSFDVGLNIDIAIIGLLDYLQLNTEEQWLYHILMNHEGRDP